METKSRLICPWWLGYFLINPLRKFRHNPDNILIPYIRPGMKIMDYGCAMGYFSLPLARLTGEKGKVYCLDIQEKMLKKLLKRADKAGLGHLIDARLVGRDDVVANLEGMIDFILLFAVVHEVPDKEGLFKMLGKLATPGARILFAEPKGHIGIDHYNHSIALAGAAGFKPEKTLAIRGSHASILKKNFEEEG